jgi:hypothetical protein
MSTGMAGAAIGCEDRLGHNPAIKTASHLVTSSCGRIHNFTVKAYYL